MMKFSGAIRHTASLVAGAYIRAIKERFGAGFMLIKIKASSKTETNAIAFFQEAQHQNRSIEEMVKEALDLFDPEFCIKTFKRKYPPFNVVISNKTLSRISKVHSRITAKNSSGFFNEYLVVLKSMDIDDAVSCLNSGWPDGTQEFRDKLKTELLNVRS